VRINTGIVNNPMNSLIPAPIKLYKLFFIVKNTKIIILLLKASLTTEAQPLTDKSHSRIYPFLISAFG
jgi:hypothetical protein